MNPKRIAIIGAGASGKSVLSREISKRTNLPLYHIDQIIWRDVWVEVPEEEYLPKHNELIKKDEWIIEGFLDDKMEDRLVLADLIIYLDYPSFLCAFRFLKRWFVHRRESRPEFHDKALEKLNLRIFLGIFTGFEKKYIEASLKKINPNKFVRIKSPSQLKSYLSGHFK